MKEEPTLTNKIQRFTIDNILPTTELKKMSKKNMQKHIEYLEQVAYQLDNSLALVLENIQSVKRASTPKQNTDDDYIV